MLAILSFLNWFRMHQSFKFLFLGFLNLKHCYLENNYVKHTMRDCGMLHEAPYDQFCGKNEAMRF